MGICDEISFEGRRVTRLVSGGTEVWVDTENGFTVLRIASDGIDLILYDPERRAAGRTYAVPILYPTPNRVRDGTFTFAGRAYAARMHGIVTGRAFTVMDRRTSEGGASVTAETEFRPDAADWNLFPWTSTLSVTIEVTEGCVQWNYAVRNSDDRPLPFGFALHPFFLRHGKTIVRLSASSVMEADEDKLPTGRLLSVEGTSFDLRCGLDAEGIDLDHVYFDEGPIAAELSFPEIGRSISLSASPDFNHAVVFTPKGKNFVCVENQTCSTDAHNLDAAGYRSVANLITVPPGGERSGWVRFRLFCA
jgi:aldose 1-epimerase